MGHPDLLETKRMMESVAMRTKKNFPHFSIRSHSKGIYFEYSLNVIINKLSTGNWVCTNVAELLGLSDFAMRTKTFFILATLDLCGKKGKYFKYKVQVVLNQLSAGDLTWRSEAGLLDLS